MMIRLAVFETAHECESEGRRTAIAYRVVVVSRGKNVNVNSE